MRLNIPLEVTGARVDPKKFRDYLDKAFADFPMASIKYELEQELAHRIRAAVYSSVPDDMSHHVDVKLAPDETPVDQERKDSK